MSVISQYVRPGTVAGVPGRITVLITGHEEARAVDGTMREFLLLMMTAFTPEEEMAADEAAVDEAVAVRMPGVMFTAAGFLAC